MSVKISVIVPVYKTEKYLDKCLNSIRAQTFKDIEIICVDDCSPDQSYKIVQRHASEDSRIKLIRHKENLGLGGARNTAIRSAKADYIASVDSDDYIHPEMMECLWSAAEDGKFDVVTCGFDTVDANGKVIATQAHKSRILVNEKNDINIFSNVSPSFWNKLWRKSLFTDNEIYFPQFVYYQDSATTPRILAKSKNIRIIDDRLYFYLERDNSATYTYSSKHLIDYFKVFDVLNDFLVKNNLMGRYRNEFLDYIDRGVRFHSKNVLKSSMEEAQLRQYLRHFLMLKIGFLELNGFVGSKDQDRLVELLGSARSKSDMLPVDSKVELPISLIVKTFLRPEMLQRFLLSVGNYEEGNGIRFAEIIVGDDSPKDVIGSNTRAIEKARDSYPHLNVRHNIYEENIGLADGRNRMVQEAKCEYILLCDDDFILDNEADIKKALGYLQSGEYDMVGGWLKNHYNLETDEYIYWGASGKLYENSEELIFELNETEYDMPEIQQSDYLLNFFVARRQTLIEVPWSNELKVEEHQEFFYRFYKSPYVAGLCKDLFVRHTAVRKDNSDRYNQFRFGKENWEQFLFKALEMMGKSRRRINRWRKNEFIVWQVDAKDRSSNQRGVPLKEPIIGQQVPVNNITPRFQNYFFGYYDVQSVSDDGRYLVCQSAPAIDRLPISSDVAQITLIDLEDRDKLKVIGETSAWCHQQGAQLQFVPGKPTSVIYNIFNEEERIWQSVEVDFSSGQKSTHEFPIAAITSDGQNAASINFARVYDYRPGYGYSHVPDPYSDDGAPENDGLVIFNLETGNSRLVLSYRQIRDALAVDWWARYMEDKWVINHIAFSPNGKKILMLIRTFSDDAPFPTFTVVCNIDGSDLRRVFGFCSHYHWKDDVTFVASGAPGFTRQKARVIKVYEVNSDTHEYQVIGDGVLREDGHCSYSPDRNFLLYDSYSNTKFPYRRLQVYSFEDNSSVELGYFFSDGKWFNNNSDLRCDLHPRWSPDGRTITFDSIHEGFRGVYSINVDDIKQAFDKPIKVFEYGDLRKWYDAKYNHSTDINAGKNKQIEKPKKNGYEDNYKSACRAYNDEKYLSALEYFQAAHAIEPDRANLKRCLAETLLRLERKNEAIGVLKDAAKLIPENKALKHRLRALQSPFWLMVYKDLPFEVPNI